MSDGPVLAEGLAEYIAAVRPTPAAAPLSPAEARLAADLAAKRIAYQPAVAMQVTTSFAGQDRGEIPVRIYRPAGDGARAALLYFHGGGFTTGSLDSYEPLAMALAEASGATVISVHYARLPQSTPFAILEQGYDALCWTADMADVLGIDRRHIGVAGDSAGAFIAAQLAVLARDRGGPALQCQFLAYGVYDMDDSRAAYQSGSDPVLGWPVIRGMIQTYRDCDARNPSPLPPPLGIADLAGLPPAIMLGAQYDPMLAEGHEYAARLGEAGVSVDMHVAPHMPHGFLRAVRFSEPARAEMRAIGAKIRNHL